MNKRIKNMKEFCSGFFFLVLGLFLVFKSVWLSVFTEYGLRVKIFSLSLAIHSIFPLGIGLLIIGFSSLLIRKSFFLPQPQENEKTLKEHGQGVVKYGFFKVSSYAILIIIYAVFFERVGFLIATGAFLLLTFKYVENQSWMVTLLAVSISIAISYLLFVYFLGIPLPPGLISGY